MNAIRIIGIILILISYIITLGLFSRIIDKRRSKKGMVYYLSKIATVKSIVEANHQSQIFNVFNEEGNLEGININYQRLLELIVDGECKKGYKKCGILDTIGNILCIDENFACPINQINVDLKAERNKYLKKGSKEIYNENLIYNYQFYYSNNSINNNITVSVLFSKSKPKYITVSNFAIDTEAYQDIIGDLPSVNEENKEKNEVDKSIQDVIIGIVSSSEPVVGNVLNVVFSLLSFSSKKYMPNKMMEEFKKYAEKRIKEEENIIDKYFINIGENAYIKNYIGFQSLKNIETFMNFDYKKIYKKIFPSKNVIIVSSIFLALDILLFIFQLSFFNFIDDYPTCVINYSYDNSKIQTANDNSNIQKINVNNDDKNESTLVNINQVEEKKNNTNNKEEDSKKQNENNNNITSERNTVIKKINKKIIKTININCSNCLVFGQIILLILFILINLWILLCAVKRYSNISKKFNDLKTIKSDDFINHFISEFIEICSKKNTLYYAAIIVSLIAMSFHVLGFILLNICQKKKNKIIN